MLRRNIRHIESVVAPQHHHLLLSPSSGDDDSSGCCKPPPYSPFGSPHLPPPPLLQTHPDQTFTSTDIKSVTAAPTYEWIYRGSGGAMPPLMRPQGSSEGSMQPLVVSTGGAPSHYGGGEEDNIEKIKCVLVGDGAVGKTSLIVSYTTNGYPTEYVPTAFDNYSVVVTVDNRPVRLQLCDTAGQDDFDSLRPLCYPGSDVFLVCFSVVSPTSFHNVKEKWLPELRQHQPTAPLLLVGTQSDLRTDVKVLIELAQEREQPVTEAAAQRLARQIGACAYIESSALTQRNLKEVFDQALLAALEARNNPAPPLTNGRINGVGSKGGKKRSMGCVGDTCGEDDDVDSLRGAERKTGWKKLCCFV